MILEFTYVIPKIISLALAKELRVSQKRWGDKPEALPLEYSSTNSKLHKMENPISNPKCTAYKTIHNHYSKSEEQAIRHF